MRGPLVVSTRLSRVTPNRWDVVAVPLVLGVLAVIAVGAHQVAAPLEVLQKTPVSLDVGNLPDYALRTTLRMLAALAASLFFTFVYGALAAKSRRAELILIPVLDVLQSVPVLGFISFTVDVLPVAVPGQRARGRVRGDLRHLHQPGLEHGLQLLPVAAHRAATTWTRPAAASACPPGSGSGGWRCPSPCRA